MVVSEMGEQWSPQTEPARQADIPIIPRLLPTGKIARTIGIGIGLNEQLIEEHTEELGINVNQFNMSSRKLSIYMFIIFNLLFGDTSDFDEDMKQKKILWHP